jgi:osmotically-inducible protein OsmY
MPAGTYGSGTVEIKPSVQAEDVKRKIEEALKRNAEVEATAIRVTVPERNKVVLEEKVGSRDAAGNTRRRKTT